MPKVGRVHRSRVVALVAYLVVSLLFFGVPIVAHPARDYIGYGFDPQIFIWSLAWWPHAILHGENPVLTRAVWAPVGVNLAWTTSVPGLALALAPLTLLAGPTVAYNAAVLLLPALAAWTAFLLCVHLTKSFWPALAGGYLFGFSSYMLGHTEGHLHMLAVFPIPLVALALVRFVEGSCSRRRLAVWLGALLAVQVSLSTELAFTLTVVLLVALALAFAIVPAVRPRLRLAALPVAGAYMLAAVIASPLLIYAFRDFESQSLNDPAAFPADLLNLVVPTRLTGLNSDWARTTSDAFVGNSAENGAYLGLPLLAIVAWFAWQRRRSPGARLLVTLLALGILAELGTALHVRGAAYRALPWRLVSDLPGFEHVLPVRFSLYVALASSVAAALWASASTPRLWIRAGLVGLAVIAVVPHLWLDVWRTHPTRPAFFADGLYRTCLGRGENLLALPYPSWGDSMLWQAEADFRFRLADGSLSPAIPHGVPLPAVAQQLLNDRLPTGGGTSIVALARKQGVTAILVDDVRSEPWQTALAAAGLEPERIGGVTLYRLDGTRHTSCGKERSSPDAGTALRPLAARIRQAG